MSRSRKRRVGRGGGHGFQVELLPDVRPSLLVAAGVDEGNAGLLAPDFLGELQIHVVDGLLVLSQQRRDVSVQIVALADRRVLCAKLSLPWFLGLNVIALPLQSSD